MERFRFPPEAILSRAFFNRKPAQFFDFYRERILAPLVTAEPNAAHRKLAEMEAAGKLRTIITQNMDDLHQEAGNRKVLELCGSVMRNNCPRCEQRISTLDILERPVVPYCDVDMCGAVMTPDIVLYGDALNEELVTNALYFVLSSNVFLVLGTNLSTYPAASIVHHYSGKKLVLINQEEHPLDSMANLVIRAPLH